MTMKKDKQKELIFYGAMGIVAIVVLFFLFKPYLKEDTDNEGGFLTSMPDAGIVSLERDRVSVFKDSQEEVSIRTKEEEIEEELEKSSNVIQTISAANSPSNQSMEAAFDAYYMSEAEWEREYERNQELYRLEEEKKELEERLALKEQQEQMVNNQMALLEKSFELQQRYNPDAIKAEQASFEANRLLQLEAEQERRKHESSDRNLNTTSVITNSGSVVSRLNSTVSDSILMQEVLSGNENVLGFHTPVGSTQVATMPRNAFKVRVDETQVLRIGDNLILMTMETIKLANGIVIPRNTPLVATTSLSGNRMRISIDALEYQGSIIGVKWVGYDLSGQEGIYVPWSDEGIAIQEFGSGVAQTAGSTFTINNNSAKDQVIADVARGLIRGGSNYLTNKVKTVKVTFKAGYQLYLMDTSNRNK